MTPVLKSIWLPLLALVLTSCASTTPSTVDSSKVDQATKQVETGARKIGEGKITEGVPETAKGIGNTVVEGAKFTGEKIKEAARAAEPEAKTGWERFKESASDFGTSVKNFFGRLFSK
jgi:hypothetical protein